MVQQKDGLGLGAEGAGGAGGGDVAAEGGFDGGGLAGFGGDAKDFGGLEEGRDGQGVRVGVDGFKGGEMAFADLLHFAGVIKLHELDEVRVAEVGDGGIVEGKMAILADT